MFFSSSHFLVFALAFIALTGEKRNAVAQSFAPVNSSILLKDLMVKYCSIGLSDEDLSTYGSVEEWDVSSVESMSGLFLGAHSCSPNISAWDVSSVTTMSNMFVNSLFNGDISRWDVSNVESMRKMFQNATFNGDVSNWDVSNVRFMEDMFMHSKFNRNISAWDLSSLVSMNGMFAYARFRGDISNFDVSNVEDMSNLFLENIQFDSDITGWDTSSVGKMSKMFAGACSFNQDISRWQLIGGTGRGVLVDNIFGDVEVDCSVPAESLLVCHCDSYSSLGCKIDAPESPLTCPTPTPTAVPTMSAGSALGVAVWLVLSQLCIIGILYAF